MTFARGELYLRIRPRKPNLTPSSLVAPSKSQTSNLRSRYPTTMASTSLPSPTGFVAAAISQSAPSAPTSSTPLVASTGHYNYSDMDNLNARRRAAPLPRAANPQAKIGPQRTSKVSQKLKILPSPADQDEESGRDVYSQGIFLPPSPPLISHLLFFSLSVTPTLLAATVTLRHVLQSRESRTQRRAATLSG